NNGNQTIYYHNSNNPDDLDLIVAKYLYGQENLVIEPESIYVQFREGHESASSIDFMRIISIVNYFRFIDIHSISKDKVREMQVSDHELPPKIINSIRTLESKIYKQINIVRFGPDSKPSIYLHDIYYINFDHHNFSILLNNNHKLEEVTLEIYFIALLKLDLLCTSLFS
ncbi:hypothetical protein, partial [Botryobacter ruber]|uniref:hypothetical protein n=1 Tax=Botryobacter ruber TaxID=2171629 RepID=UPI0013E3A8B0